MMNLDFEDSLKTYNQGKASYQTVMWLRDRPFRAASVCLGLLCVILLIGVITLANQQPHHQVGVDQSINIGNISMKLAQMKTSNSNLTKERDQLQTSNHNLTQERDQLQTSNTKLIQEGDQLKTSNNKLTQVGDYLRTSNNNLTEERDQLKTSNRNMTDLRDRLQINYNQLSQERGRSMTSDDNVTPPGPPQQTGYNDLTQERDELRARYNQLADLRDQLQTSNNNLTHERDQLQISNNNLRQQKDQLVTSNNNLTQERDQLQTSNNYLTEERDHLKTELHQLIALNANITICPSKWTHGDDNCYFISKESKSWKESRKYCQEKGADLVIINTKAEQDFLMTITTLSSWIGLSDLATESVWKWIDGSPLKKLPRESEIVPGVSDLSPTEDPGIQT
ncbi:hypothetical protein NHX12_018204 [Muraenolepis orangiensis]|uniref:C-type lectin domain-containing protein n=1 Tax=Muraenolepis orangiensis TaxID=630683 RepID=A0A9Q0EXW1_9TELE|nr:hypothetical protein NHX12_018204 [Muraenolepis orangiensis]